jgi:hypothetical protein
LVFLGVLEEVTEVVGARYSTRVELGTLHL